MRKAVLAALAALVIALPSFAQAKPKVSGNVSFSAVDKHLAGPGFVPNSNPGIQSSVGANVSGDLGNVSGSYWGSVAGSSEKDQEHDGMVSYTSPALSLGEFGSATATIGGLVGNSYGAILGEGNVTLALSGPVNLQLMVAHDVKDGSGTYGWALAGGNIPMGKGFVFDAKAAAVFNSNYFTESTGLSGGMFNVGVSKNVGPVNVRLGARRFEAHSKEFQSALSGNFTVNYKFESFLGKSFK